MLDPAEVLSAGAALGRVALMVGALTLEDMLNLLVCCVQVSMWRGAVEASFVVSRRCYEEWGNSPTRPE